MSKIKTILKTLRNDLSYRSAKRSILKNRIINKSKRVVFICQCESLWPKSEPVYLALKNKGIDCKLLVVEDLMSEKKEVSIFEKYNDDVVYYKNGIIDELNPKIVFYPRPYDHYLPKDVRTKNVVKKALIAYIPYYFYQRGGDNGLLKKTFSDRVCFYFADQKEAAEQYKNISAKGIKNGHLHCLEFGYPFFETIGKLFETSDLSKSAFIKNKEGLKILWTPRWEFEGENGGSNFLKYKDFIFDKFVNNKEYSFVFRPHPLLFDNFIKKGALSVEEKDSILNMLKESNNSNYDHSGDYLDTFMDCDILISDTSSMILEFASFGKPLLYCDSNDNEDSSSLWNEIIEKNYFIRNKEELIKCFDEVIKGENESKIQKRKMLSKEILDAHKNSAERIAEYIIKQLG